MTDNQALYQQQLLHQHCLCDVCKNLVTIHKQTEELHIMKKNDLDLFLKTCIPNQLIPIIPTTFVTLKCASSPLNLSNKSQLSSKINKLKHKTKTNYNIIHYTTHNKLRMQVNQISNILENYNHTINIIVYGSHKSKIIHKHCIKKQLVDEEVKYIQAYNILPMFSVYYDKMDNKLDDIISQQINKRFRALLKEIRIIQKLSEQQYSSSRFYQKEKQWQNWIMEQYGQQTLARYLIQMHAQIVQVSTGNKLKKGIFYWCVERQLDPLGKQKKNGKADLKLINVQNLQIDYYRGYNSFQFQYEKKILDKINSIKIDIPKLTPAFEKDMNPFNERLDNFKLRIKDFYESEKNKVLGKIQEEKYTSTVKDNPQIQSKMRSANKKYTDYQSKKNYKSFLNKSPQRQKIKSLIEYEKNRLTTIKHKRMFIINTKNNSIIDNRNATIKRIKTQY